MSEKKGRIITVEGCPCEVVEESTTLEYAVAYTVEDGPLRHGRIFCADATGYRDRSVLCVAPDGELVLIYDATPPFVSYAHESPGMPWSKLRTENHLRRLAREMQR